MVAWTVKATMNLFQGQWRVSRPDETKTLDNVLGAERAWEDGVVEEPSATRHLRRLGPNFTVPRISMQKKSAASWVKGAEYK